MIISKFTDYYDYLGATYGIDYKYAYKRLLLEESDVESLSSEGTVLRSRINRGQHGEDLIYPSTCDPAKKEVFNQYEFLWLIICGRSFFIYRKKAEKRWSVLTADSFFIPFLPLLTTSVKNQRHHYFLHYSQRKSLEFCMGQEISEKNLQVNIAQKAPIVAVGYSSRYTNISAKSPILGDIIHFTKLYPAETIFQEIEYFFLNQVNGSPDSRPPVEVSDAHRIVAKGFDLKTSFRPKIKSDKPYKD